MPRWIKGDSNTCQRQMHTLRPSTSPTHTYGICKARIESSASLIRHVICFHVPITSSLDIDANMYVSLFWMATAPWNDGRSDAISRNLSKLLHHGIGQNDHYLYQLARACPASPAMHGSQHEAIWAGLSGRRESTFCRSCVRHSDTTLSFHGMADIYPIFYLSKNKSRLLFVPYYSSCDTSDFTVKGQICSTNQTKRTGLHRR